MALSPEPPFFLIQLDDFDVEVFTDLRQLGGILEPPELENPDFALYDSKGLNGELRIERWDVVVSSWERPSSDQEFQSYLRRFIESKGHSPRSDEIAELALQASSIATGR